MKFYKISIIFLFLLILSMGVVCAEDSNQTAQSTLDVDDVDVLGDDEGTYTDLDNEIQPANSITLEKDYKYNSSSDVDKTYLKLSNKNLTIEGNNKIIDGDQKAGFLNLSNSNLTIKNLRITNCSSSSIILKNSILNLINITFDNNFDNTAGAAIYAIDSNITSANSTFSNNNAIHKIDITSGGAIFSSNSILNSTNDKFLNNYAQLGSSIYVNQASRLNMSNAQFKNDNPVLWGLIYGNHANIYIFNSTFADTTSKYATAIYNTFITTIKKTKFINLHANLTAGAVAVKPSLFNTTTVILDSEFINVSSSKNGGALYLDIYGIQDGVLTGDVFINNTIFNNCSSEFGGAVLQLGGSLEISYSQFINNNAKENGGAIYTSYVKLDINNSNFTNNNASADYGFGGAVYFDIGSLTVALSNFKGNVAREGGAIYAYDSQYKIKDSTFANNGDDIRTYFDKKDSAVSNCGDLNKNLNLTKSEFEVRFYSEPYALIPYNNITDASAGNVTFDLREYNLVTPVRDQGFMGACWAFGAAGAFESAFLKATGIVLDISENNIQNMGLKYSIYGNNLFSEAGTYGTSTAYFMSWLGAVNATDDVYDELGKISALRYSPHEYHIVDAIYVNIEDRNAVKEALIKYGALNLFVYGANSRDGSYNDTYKSVYNTNHSGNHYVTLIGWNDTFSKDHFSTTAPGDGAWICKNSWGTDWGDDGYFYLSYFDKALTGFDAVGFVIKNNESYEKLYQIEAGGMSEFDQDYNEYEDVFVSDGGDIIAAVGSYFEKANTAYTISIYLKGNLVYTQNGVVTHRGYNTINLDKRIAVEDGAVFSVRIKSTAVPVLTNTRQQLYNNNSFVLVNGVHDFFKDAVIPIKVYSYHNNITTKNIVKCYDGKEVIFTVEGATDTVIIGFNGKNTTVPLDENGTGSVNLGVLALGNYDVNVYYKNQTYMNYVVVKSSIDTDGLTSVNLMYNVKLTITAQLFDFNADPLVKKLIGVTFDGKEVSGMDTDGDGYLNVVIFEDNDIGKHILNIENPVTGEKFSITVNILSRISGNANVNMYYYDGHTYNVRVKDNEGNFVGKNQIVTFKIGKKTFNVKTDANGYATLKIPNTITPGKYTISATFAGQTVQNTLKVKQVLKLTKVQVKKSAKKLVLKATLKKGSKALKSKKVTFKFNGKKYTAKTNKKGLAKVTIKPKVLKKLKVGKKVKYQVTYLKNTVKRTVKVKR